MAQLNKITYVSILLLLIHLSVPGQSRYALTRLPISSHDYDEFCPSLFGDTLLFSSNRENEFLLTYHNGNNKGLLNIFMLRLHEDTAESKPSVLSRSLVTPFNDGPAAFSPDGKRIVYSRNQLVKARRRNILKRSNPLGIYFADPGNGSWIPTEDFPYNHPEYSITTPCFGPEGRYLYFASDMPGGFGGTDLYSSEWKDGAWGEPVNLGSNINTAGNEVYPYLSASGDLFFASDGLGGLGGKDIYVSRFDGRQWLAPFHLAYPLNSEKDDFGLITDRDFSEGYLSSNRERSDDIFRFYTRIPQLFDCDSMLSNNYCYEFWDEEYPGIDSLPVIYEWSFSDGTKVQGLRVSHCFPGPGEHWAKLNIIDDRTDSTFYTQSSIEFEIADHEQPFIGSVDEGAINDTLAFKGLDSYMPGFQIEQYIWDFGDGGFAEGPEVEHIYSETGTYMVKLGLKVRREGAAEVQISCVQKPVQILSKNPY
jgi:hypothetical protein